MTTTTDTGTYDNDIYRRELTREEVELTLAKVAKINARAEKRGWTGRLVVDAKATEVTETNSAGIEITRLVYLTAITGDAPKYDGWTFLAVLDWHSAGGELITRVAPGVETAIAQVQATNEWIPSDLIDDMRSVKPEVHEVTAGNVVIEYVRGGG